MTSIELQVSRITKQQSAHHWHDTASVMLCLSFIQRLPRYWGSGKSLISRYLKNLTNKTNFTWPKLHMWWPLSRASCWHKQNKQEWTQSPAGAPGRGGERTGERTKSVSIKQAMPRWLRLTLGPLHVLFQLNTRGHQLQEHVCCWCLFFDEQCVQNFTHNGDFHLSFHGKRPSVL